MKPLLKALALTVLLVTLGGISQAQTALTQTALTAAVGGGLTGYSGVSSALDSFIIVSSTTSFVAPVNGVPQSYAYIDREALGVVSVNTTTKVIGVSRGQLGTQAAPHANNSMVLVGTPGQFFSADPPPGNCTTANTVSTPWINVLTGAQWLCSTVTLNWVPGFGNPGNSSIPPGVSKAVASAAGQVTPTGPLFHITGALAITGFVIPVGFNATAQGGGSFCVIPDGTFTTTTANNIALASTAVVNKLLCFTWDATNSKLVPTY